MRNMLMVVLAAMTVCMSAVAQEKVTELEKSRKAVDTFFEQFAQKRDTIGTFEGQFHQVIAAPEETIDANGTLVYVKPKNLLFRYTDTDENATFLIHNRRVYEYSQENKQLDIYDLDDDPQTQMFFLGFDADTETLLQAYDVSLFAPDKGVAPGASQGLMIKPKENADASAEDLNRDKQTSTFKEVKLFLRESDYLPVRIELINEDDSKTTLTVSDFKVRSKPSPDKVKVSIAEDTKVIENGRFIEKVGSDGMTIPQIAPESQEPSIQATELPPPTPVTHDDK